MFGLAAAPEMVTAVPSEMPFGPPYSRELRYPSLRLPVCIGVAVNESAIRCCHARLSPEVRLRAMLMTCIGERTSATASLGSLRVADAGAGMTRIHCQKRWSRMARLRTDIE